MKHASHFLIRALLGVACLTPLGSGAWTAIATNPVGGSFIHSEALTPEQARAEAMKGCATLGGGRCEILGKPVNGTAVVIVKSDSGRIWLSSSRDPKASEKEAMHDCKKHGESGCRVAAAVWDPGKRWLAIAQTPGSLAIVVNESTRAAAIDLAFEECEKLTENAGSCSVSEANVQSSKLYFSRSLSKQTGAHFYYLDPNSQTNADKASLDLCVNDKTTPNDCKVVERYHNKGPLPEPAYMKALRAKVEKSNR